MLSAQGYPIFLVDIFMTFILQAGFSKRHQKVPNWAVVLKSSLHGKMKLFPAASPAAAIAANRGITLVCLLHLCSFYRECELFFILQFDEFFSGLFILFTSTICACDVLKFSVKSRMWVSYVLTYFNLTSFFFCLQLCVRKLSGDILKRALLTGNGSASNCAFFYKTRRIRNTWCTVYRKRKCTESNLSLHLGLIIIIVPSEMISPNFELQNLINEFVSLNSCSFYKDWTMFVQKLKFWVCFDFEEN